MEKMGVNMCRSVFGYKLKTIRKKRGLTQAKLADKLGVCASTIGMYEQGRREPDNKMLAKICEVLNVSTDYLIGFDKFDKDMKKEVDDVIDEFINTLEKQPNLMFDGKPITEDDRDKIVTAIKIAASVAIYGERKSKKNNEK